MLFKGQLYLENTGRILPKGVGWKSVNLSQCGPVADFAKYDQRRLSPLKTPQEKKKTKQSQNKTPCWQSTRVVEWWGFWKGGSGKVRL